MSTTVLLPALPPVGPCVLRRWHKAPGDTFAAGELIAEIEADKALMEWRAAEAGVLLERLVAEDAALDDATPIAVIRAPDAGVSAAATETVVSLLYARYGPAER